MKMEMMKCPVCGGGLIYTGETWQEDDTERAGWKCSKCGADGVALSNIVFAEHYDVKDADGNEVELHEPMHLFWVGWISNDKNGKARMNAMYDSYLTMDEAMYAVKKVKSYPDAVLVWIDETEGLTKIGTPYIELLVDTLGQRRKVARHDEA